MTAPTPSSRPRIVDIAFWCFIAGAVIMIVGGLMALTATYDAARSAIPPTVSDEQVRSYLTIYRFSGIGSVLAAGALAFLAGRARRGDARFRLATLALGFAAVVVVGMLAIGVGVAQPLILLGLLPVLIGALLLVQPSARLWFQGFPGKDLS
ncbi:MULTISPECIES: hypothetical protein [Mycolicibacterium]|jgi:peptidoglycan/LPS O-acetylase OafA/YrhL|uniref:Transmembrane protein n=2 Tax=Mycolicibacterium TaxID=1866885 RepID=A1T3D7_MYCVP|nr:MULTISPECIES: hypothetical protein [Mycolicibacterium]ABM11687.1 conserved hypothetical protein [Mycolicibacterium vanbaalenii PYR-1]MCV7126242.1 hypothetical protein [Mycolicibacterium vanbaalenii PYR-1]MDN4517476.1 hypothetical protein [Mycolicibacterium austroafricanum]MDW5614178.1 hypothetical protein [Mycolicibacterium sp. D5.8-2]QRZ07564.1 hypothetical protein JN090_03095 [Mycolicibacterium austroafricanum]